MPNSGPVHLLLLAGTAEAAGLDTALAGDGAFRVTVALAGVTRNARTFHGDVRRGGFGGATGLTTFLRDAAIDLLVDATHPFAAQMSAHAVQAATAGGIPILRLTRPPWTQPRDTTWLSADDLAHAARLLPPDATAFLALGQRHLAAFQDHSATLIVRSIDPPPAGLLPAARWIIAPPGRTAAAERALFAQHGVSHLVARNSGGGAGWPKIVAASEADLPTIMIYRPPQVASDIVLNVADAVNWVRTSAGRIRT